MLTGVENSKAGGFLITARKLYYTKTALWARRNHYDEVDKIGDTDLTILQAFKLLLADLPNQ